MTEELQAEVAAYDAALRELDRAIRAARGAVSAVEAVQRRLVIASDWSWRDRLGVIWVSQQKRAALDDAARVARTAQRALADLAATLPAGIGVLRRLPDLTVAGRRWDVWVGGFFIDRWVDERIMALCHHVALVHDHTCQLEYVLKKRQDSVEARRSATLARAGEAEEGAAR